MSGFLTSAASVLGILNIFIGLFALYRIIKCIFKPISFKGKLYSFIFAIVVLSFIVSGLDILIPNIIEKPIPLFITCLCTFILLIFVEFKFIKCKKYNQYSIKQLDIMDGHTFEYACANILKSNGFKNVEVTRGSGDFGVDIVAENNGIKYAVQCKCYSHKLDNTPIQEVIGGLAYYHCQKAIVMTNNYFTEPAKVLAKINNVELWDRDMIIRTISKKEHIKKTKFKKKVKIKESFDLKNAETLVGENSVTQTEQQYIYNPQKENLIKNKYNRQKEIMRLAKQNAKNSNLESLRKLAEKYCQEQLDHIMCFYNEMKDFDILITQTHLSFEKNEVKYVAELFGDTTTSKIRRAKSELTDYLNVSCIRFENASALERSIYIIIPLPISIYNSYLNTNIDMNRE